MDLHQEANKVQASIQISRQSQQRNQEGITSQSLIQSRIADTSVQNVGQRPKHTKPEIAIIISASKSSIRKFAITEKATTRAFSWLKAATTAFTFKTLLRHYVKRALTPRSLNVKLGPRRKGHKGRAVWLA